MSHDTSALTISLDEAQRIEKISSTQLIQNRKLILVVDLDQTVIQASTETSIGKVMVEPSDPNYESIKDVRSFDLQEEHILPASDTEPARRGIKATTYYVKLRPGLEEFLEKMHLIYEMHVYTMATRSYAEAIANIIDPDKRFFGDRILSRDESGNIYQKSLKRLFPVSTAMVAVIDDRGDVWGWSPNLVKVVPYNFFRIGDINSPPLFNNSQIQIEEPPIVSEPIDSPIQNDNGSEDDDTTKNDSDDPNVTVATVDSNGVSHLDESLENGVSNTSNTDNNNTEDTTPVKDTNDDTSNKENASIESTLLDDDSPNSGLVESTQYQQQNQPRPSALNLTLHDTDNELMMLEPVLSRLHSNYYKHFDDVVKRRGGFNNVRERDLPDVGVIMPEMKDKVLDGCVILFSGYIDYSTNFDNFVIVQWARSFGAIVVAEMIDSVTHVVSKSNTTTKARKAFTKPKIKVVSIAWLYRCIATWERVSEEPYLLEPPAADNLTVKDDMNENVVYHSTNDDEELDDNDIDFVKSLNTGSIDWDQIEEELKDFMSDEDEDENAGEHEDEEEENKEKDSKAIDTKNDIDDQEQDDDYDDDDDDEDSDDDDDSDEDDDDDDNSEDDEDISEEEGNVSLSAKRPPENDTSTSAKRLPNGTSVQKTTYSGKSPAQNYDQSNNNGEENNNPLKRDWSHSSLESDEDEDESTAPKRQKTPQSHNLSNGHSDVSSKESGEHSNQNNKNSPNDTSGNVDESDYDEDAFAAELELDLV